MSSLFLLSYFLSPGFRLANTKCLATVDQWKKLYHPNVVQLKEVFTTTAFGDNCKFAFIIFILFFFCLHFTGFIHWIVWSMFEQHLEVFSWTNHPLYVKFFFYIILFCQTTRLLWCKQTDTECQVMRMQINTGTRP